MSLRKNGSRLSTDNSREMLHFKVKSPSSCGSSLEDSLVSLRQHTEGICKREKILESFFKNLFIPTKKGMTLNII